MAKGFAEEDLRIFKVELPPAILLDCCINCYDMNQQKNSIRPVADFAAYIGVQYDLWDRSHLVS